MTVQATQAADELAGSQGEVSSHKLISLLMAGMLERVSQAKNCVADGNDADKEILLAKILAILNGLRASLNFNDGGEIAMNLNSLYEYMISQINDAESSNEESRVLDEVAALILEVKTGWDQIPVEETSALA